MSYERKLLRDIAPYMPGEQPTGDVIKLNTNENPYPPSPKVLEAIRSLGANDVARYPNAVSQRLREVAAERYGYPSAEWVFAGNGMDEVLALALRTFVDPGDKVLSVYPTYSLYETLTKLHGAEWTTADLDEDFQLPEGFAETKARLCFLPRPNAPSGVAAPREAVEQLCESFDGLVFIDEAYADFAKDNCMDFPKRYPNAIVGRTFSKSFGLAGLRLGLAFAQPEIIESFMKTKDSYNVNAVTQAAGVAALEDYAHMEANVARICATRTRLTDALRELGFTVPDSEANYVFASREGAREIFERLKERNIFVRYFDERGLDDGLRISVGTDEEIHLLLQALKEIIGTGGPAGSVVQV